MAYGGFIALEGVDLDLRGPGLYMVVGPNGAGKTTLLRVIAGLVKPLRGRVAVNGVDVTGKPHVASRHVGYVPHRQALPETPLTVFEYVRYRAALSGAGLRVGVGEALEAVGLERGLWGARMDSLSAGLAQRVELAALIALGVGVYLVDEPLASIDYPGRHGVVELLGSLSRSSLVIVTCHDPRDFYGAAKGVVLLDRKVVAVGGREALLDRELLRAAYRGMDFPAPRAG